MVVNDVDVCLIFGGLPRRGSTRIKFPSGLTGLVTIVVIVVVLRSSLELLLLTTTARPTIPSDLAESIND
ncbi:hypothetical protein DERF_005010 [Dermatophagoides farinae]|uniref:Uncharacterized protein n=1 Tax=Dermatophagoides farinae TaxID=6954 RepID=A0A922I4U8_DERFA|nr:hypothetical protein DERF_005010 [Dermatophagoides farinae]